MHPTEVMLKEIIAITTGIITTHHLGIDITTTIVIHKDNKPIDEIVRVPTTDQVVVRQQEAQEVTLEVIITREVHLLQDPVEVQALVVEVGAQEGQTQIAIEDKKLRL